MYIYDVQWVRVGNMSFYKIIFGLRNLLSFLVRYLNIHIISILLNLYTNSPDKLHYIENFKSLQDMDLNSDLSIKCLNKC